MDIRLQITTGSPTDEEIAVVTATLLGIAAATPAEAPTRRAPAWARASRMEATGQAPFATSVDPRLQARPSGALPPGAV